MSVVRAFDRAAGYDRHATVQRRVAEQLAARITALPLPQYPRIIEIGCGTGFLGAALIDRLPGARWWMTDIAPTMIERARARFIGRSELQFVVMDGAEPLLEGPFDLICSSLAMQWFPDLPAAITRLRRLLSPAGRLAFTTLAEGSFAEWREAHGELAYGTADYPSANSLSKLGLDITVETLLEHHASARDFLHALKAIGAGTPRAGHRPLGPAHLREVMARFEARGASARYVVATCLAGAL